MGSFSIPLSGLDADSTALNTIANNLANLNTTGFKSQSVNFSDLFYQQVGTSGSGDPIEVGAGTQVTSTETDFSNGSPTATTSASDVALQGAGFFVVQAANDTEYTRDGTFNLTNDGFLTTQAGLSVLGYPATAGVVNTDASAVPLQIPIGQVEAPKSTTTMSFISNLDADSGAAASTGFSFAGTLGASGTTASPTPITLYDSNGNTHVATVTLTNDGTAAGVTSWGYSISVAGSTSGAATGTLTYNSTTGALTSATPVTASFSGFADGANALALSWDPSTLTEIAGATSALSGEAQQGGLSVAGSNTFDVPVAVYDSLGNQQQASVTFTRDVNAPNSWNYSVALPAGTYGGAAGATNTGVLGFNSDGALATINGVTATAATGTIPVSFAGMSDGAANLSFNWNLYNANGAPNLSQVAQTSSSSATYQNGYAPGTYNGYTIDSTGLVSAQFSNGQTTAVGQLAVASITNEQGLTRLGDNNYATTDASGAATDGVAGLGGLGSIDDSALEGSNVDISTEFADLIVAQRGFEADSKAVTTFDTVAQETINLIH
jgi:flagellar hook protein FlgE